MADIDKVRELLRLRLDRLEHDRREAASQKDLHRQAEILYRQNEVRMILASLDDWAGEE